MLGGEGELEAPARSRGEPGSGFSRYVCGMIVEDQLDRSVRRIGGIDKPEELDELSTAVAIFDKGVDLAGEQINSSQQAERAMAFVFMVACKGGVDAGLGRQIRRRRCDGLDGFSSQETIVTGFTRQPNWRRRCEDLAVRQALCGRGQSAIDGNNCATDEAAGSRREIQCDPRHVLRRTHALHRRVLDDLAGAVLVDRVRHL